MNGYSQFFQATYFGSSSNNEKNNFYPHYMIEIKNIIFKMLTLFRIQSFKYVIMIIFLSCRLYLYQIIMQKDLQRLKLLDINKNYMIQKKNIMITEYFIPYFE
ncbi:unnamed protein product [Paramecium sonneborni]|uniref:Transmembrane protein n=1 Tax=Paramecium sonneborni TaxID=65129 RepID=A0A8S1RSA1_9CILI|nr:unnamed protein product [Paramecium sonneborni]